MKPLSKIACAIAPSATLAIDALAKQMKADGIDVIGFGAGEPDFNTPDYIKQAGIAAINANKTKYTPSAGTLSLREAICKDIKKNLGLDYKPSQICVTSGAKHNVFVTLQALLNEGDEVILPAPYWVTYEEAVKMAGGVPVIVETTEEERFKLTPEKFEAAITDKTKCVIITNPSNPTGMVYKRDELENLAALIVKNDIYVISDEIYDFLTYNGDCVSIATLGDEIRERTVIINGVSKTYAMTGWRIGYSASNQQIASVISNYLSHSTSNPATMSQFAAEAAYTVESGDKYEMKNAFDERRRYFVDRVNKIDGVSCLEPDGAFYIFMNIKPQLGRTLYGTKIENSVDFASCLLKNGLVAVVPGSAFGAEGYLRWSYAASMENIEKGLDRLEKFLREE
ncbi:MAG: pyridoxal phosphate-dependent aminotransferase [Oscillospiraceae bacterium]|nr:pyridoxal phosphate-dependent aminotransferase [Oscillospiraceae bacterium]